MRGGAGASLHTGMCTLGSRADVCGVAEGYTRLLCRSCVCAVACSVQHLDVLVCA